MKNLEVISLAGLPSGVLDLTALFQLWSEPGLLYGVAVHLAMSRVVVPLSAASKR